MPGYAEPMHSPEYTVYKIHAKTGTRTTSLILLADCIQKTRPILFFFFFPSKSSYLTVVLGSSSLPSEEMKLNELSCKRNVGSNIQ